MQKWKFNSFCTRSHTHRRLPAPSLSPPFSHTRRLSDNSPACISCTIVKIAEADGSDRLHAILVVVSTKGIGSASELRAWGAARLPAEMVPQTFETMDSMVSAQSAPAAVVEVKHARGGSMSPTVRKRTISRCD